MNRRVQSFLGFGLLLVVIAAVAGFQILQGRRAGVETVVVRGLIGSEKENFLNDPDVVRLLAERGLDIDFQKVGSIEMVRGETTGQDFLWPSSQIAEAIYDQRPDAAGTSEIVFNSPIVLYAWRDVTTSLVAAGLAEQTGDVYRVERFPELIQRIEQRQPWSEIGVPIYGPITIQTTDPTRSNSGLLFSGLLANVRNGGQVVDGTTITTVLPFIVDFYARLGFTETGSGDLFRQFLSTGMGAKPIIAGYENQLIEFSIANQEYRDLLRDEIDILYPAPTVTSSHPLIALTPNGERLLEAMRDPEIQRLAWEKHGFRSGLIGVENDPAVLDVVGVPATVDAIIPVPRPEVMQRIIDALEQRPEPAVPPATAGTPAA